MKRRLHYVDHCQLIDRRVSMLISSADASAGVCVSCVFVCVSMPFNKYILYNNAREYYVNIYIYTVYAHMEMHVNNGLEPSSVLSRLLTFAVYGQTHYVAVTVQPIYLYMYTNVLYTMSVLYTRPCVCVCACRVWLTNIEADGLQRE